MLACLFSTEPRPNRYGPKICPISKFLMDRLLVPLRRISGRARSLKPALRTLSPRLHSCDKKLTSAAAKAVKDCLNGYRLPPQKRGQLLIEMKRTAETKAVLVRIGERGAFSLYRLLQAQLARDMAADALISIDAAL